MTQLLVQRSRLTSTYPGPPFIEAVYQTLAEPLREGIAMPWAY